MLKTNGSVFIGSLAFNDLKISFSNHIKDIVVEVVTEIKKENNHLSIILKDYCLLIFCDEGFCAPLDVANHLKERLIEKGIDGEEIRIDEKLNAKTFGDEEVSVDSGRYPSVNFSGSDFPRLLPLLNKYENRPSNSIISAEDEDPEAIADLAIKCLKVIDGYLDGDFDLEKGREIGKLLFAITEKSKSFRGSFSKDT